MSENAEEKTERILVLCVDRDNDLGVKARIKTPVLGREENLNAAVSLALQDPEDPDSNAVFEAVRIYDRLRDNGVPEENQIATITGLERAGVDADRKIISELTSVLEEFPASGVILVTDGYSDEAVLPLIQSRVPVNSVRRIVIKHSESIEETAAIFSRYLKIVTGTPRYSRYLLGLPGILIIVLAVLSLIPSGLLYAWTVIFVIVGTFFFIKGFGIDEKIRRYSPPPLSGQIIGFSAAMGILLIGIGSYQALSYLFRNWDAVVTAILGFYPPTEPAQWLVLLPPLIGHFISRSITLIVIGVCVLLSGLSIRYFLRRDPRIWRTFVVIVAWAWSRQILYEVSQILISPEWSYQNLVFDIIVGILLTLTTALITFLLNKRYAPFFKGGDTIEDLSETIENQQ